MEDIRPIKSFINGSLNAFAGIFYSLQNPHLFHNFREFLQPLIAISLLLYAIEGILSIIFLPFIIFFPGFIFQTFTLIPYWSYSITQTLFPHKLQSLFMDELRFVNPSLATELQQEITHPKIHQNWWRAIWNNIHKSWHFTKYSLLLVAISSFPYVGPFIAFFGQTLLVAERLEWNLFSVYTNDCKKMNYYQQKQWIKERRFPLLGFTLPFAIFTSIPLIGPFLLGFGSSAAAYIFSNVFCEKKNRMDELFQTEKPEKPVQVESRDQIYMQNLMKKAV